jgi:malonate-semialdehyde dehydrogenase (acetylating) / methylmalonate-semialdehyde dehydrogenase
MEMETLTHWIGGGTVNGGSHTAPVFNPATGKVTRRVAMGGSGEVARAVATASEAFAGWCSSPLARRTQILFRFRQLVEAHQEELALAIVREHGKVLSDARGEVRRGLDVVEFACGIPHLLKGEFSENVSTDHDVYSVRQPLGVVAGITPFNFPVMVPMWMYPLAIACGNTFVLKPSEKDPSPSLLVAELWKAAGLPDGVFNVVQGGREAAESILAHPDVRAVSFVGSTAVARSVHQAATASGKRVQALGGAKNHMVVLADADLDQAADAAVSAGYGSAGERCMAISVLVAVGGIADGLVERLRARIAALSVGDGLEDPDMGPLITREHRDRVAGYLDQASGEGAMLAVDGRSHRIQGRDGGFFLGPCLVDHVTPGMAVYRDEIFGPVLSVVRVESIEAALDLIHANPHANGVAIFTRDGGLARYFQHAVEVGMVGINVPIPVPVASYSFGGWKDSLFGDTHVYGEDGVRFYTRGKVITARWRLPASGPRLNLAFPTGG